MCACCKRVHLCVCVCFDSGDSREYFGNLVLGLALRFGLWGFLAVESRGQRGNRDKSIAGNTVVAEREAYWELIERRSRGDK